MCKLIVEIIMFLKTSAFLIFNACYMIFIFSIYAKTLIKLGRNNNALTKVLSFIIYLLFSIILLLPIFNIDYILKDFRYYSNNFEYYVYVFGVGYFLTCIFSIYTFNKKYMKKLQKHGYFK